MSSAIFCSKFYQTVSLCVDFWMQVALASGYHADLIKTVREAQLGLSLANVKTIDAWGLPLEPDGLHLNTESAVRLGQMLADTFLSSFEHQP
jgi:hypothetical protein